MSIATLLRKFERRKVKDVVTTGSVSGMRQLVGLNMINLVKKYLTARQVHVFDGSGPLLSSILGFLL